MAYLRPKAPVIELTTSLNKLFIKWIDPNIFGNSTKADLYVEIIGFYNGAQLFWDTFLFDSSRANPDGFEYLPEFDTWYSIQNIEYLLKFSLCYRNTTPTGSTLSFSETVEKYIDNREPLIFYNIIADRIDFFSKYRKAYNKENIVINFIEDLNNQDRTFDKIADGDLVITGRFNIGVKSGSELKDIPNELIDSILFILPLLKDSAKDFMALNPDASAVVFKITDALIKRNLFKIIIQGDINLLTELPEWPF